MKLKFSIIVLFFVIFCMSCSKKLSVKDFEKFQHKTFLLYSTNNIYAAEKALKNALKVIPTFEKNHVKGIDYDDYRSVIHDRLFLIYKTLNETSNMDYEFQQSRLFLARSLRRSGLPPPPVVSYNELAKEINMVEHGADVQWKTNNVTPMPAANKK